MRYFITLSYDGTAYHGWQIQPNGISVQQCMEQALTTLLRVETPVVGAGRTDAGVHAIGAGGKHHLAGDAGAVQVSAGGDDDGFGIINGAKSGLYAGDLAAIGENFHDLRLLQLQILLQLQHVLHILLILPEWLSNQMIE